MMLVFHHCVDMNPCSRELATSKLRNGASRCSRSCKSGSRKLKRGIRSTWVRRVLRFRPDTLLLSFRHSRQAANDQ